MMHLLNALDKIAAMFAHLVDVVPAASPLGGLVSGLKADLDKAKQAMVDAVEPTDPAVPEGEVPDPDNSADALNKAEADANDGPQHDHT